MNRILFLLAGLVGAVAVGLGAFAAHGLEAKLSGEGLDPELIVKRLKTCEIAARYHLVHAVVLLGLAIAPPNLAPRTRALATMFLVAGLLMFSGILYAQSILGLKGFNLVVPLGGLSFILGWLTIATLAFQASTPQKNAGAP